MRSALLTALASVALAGCGDLLPDSNRVPTSLRLERDTVTVLQGDTAGLRVTVLDQNGEPFDRIPSWAGPVWTVEGGAVLSSGASIVGVAPGEARGTVSVGKLSTTAVLRVNPRSLQLTVDGAYLTQSVQRPDGSVPLVAGRDALLRVFLRGDQINFFRPQVRVQLLRGGAVQETLTLQATSDSIPVARREGDLRSTWNVLIPGARVQPGLSMVVEADPAGAVPRKAGSVARFPATGAIALDVRAVPRMWLRLVPIRQLVHNTTGAVTEANKGLYVRDLVAMHPIADYDVDVRAPYSTSASSATGDGWLTIIEEIAALRTADASGRYYYGLLTAQPGSGIAGLGYIGFPVAIGYDILPDGANTLSHELGHNFGRRHTPCGNPTGVDPAYPYPGALLGAFGYDILSGAVKNPDTERDVMSYCRPRWPSDYTYRAVFDFRRAGDNQTSGGTPAPSEPSLLVWGRLGGGGSVIEPAFEISTRPALPSRPGPYTLQGVDAAGAVLFSLPFAGEEVADSDTGARHFAFALPARMAQTERLAALRVTGPGVAVERLRANRAARPGVRPLAPRATGRRVGREVRLEWSRAELPMALVRDARTGQVLSFARGGAARMETGARDLDVTFSDGVRSVRATVEVQ